MPPISQKQQQKVIKLKLLNLLFVKGKKTHNSELLQEYFDMSLEAVWNTENSGRPQKIAEKVERNIVRESKT